MLCNKLIEILKYHRYYTSYEDFADRNTKMKYEN